MKSKNTKALLSMLLAASVSLSSIGTAMVFASNEDGSITAGTVEELMGKLPENYKTYLETQSGSKIKLRDDVDLTKDEKIKVIVELKSDPMAVQGYKNEKSTFSITADLEAEHEEFKQAVNKKQQQYNAKENNEYQEFKQEDENTKVITDVEFGYEFTEVFNGIAMTISANEVELLAEMDLVKAIWSDVDVELELPKEDVNYFTTDGATPFMFDSIPGIGVDMLHEEEIFGSGIKIGVMDTGVDYNHPDLKNAYKGGYDYVDNDDNPMETTYKEWQESGRPEINSNGNSYYTSHGTHVSGTILGRGENEIDTAITGVAPEADLYAYRVLGPYGSGSSEGILAAIDQSVKDGMDVINLSLGMGVNDPLLPQSVAINNCMLYTNTTAVVAAGNSGPNAYTVGSPGAAPLAITVGANNSIMSLNTVEGTFLEDTYNLTVFAKSWSDNVEDLLDKNLPLEYVELGKVGDFADKDLNGKIALIQRGEISFVEKIANAKNAGAEAAIIFNNVDGDISMYLGESDDYIMSLAMNKEQGEMLKAKLEEASEETITFANIEEVKSDGNKLVDFSSKGPVTNTLDIKPELTGPGEDILSTVPGFINDKESDGDFNYNVSYGRMSGTSMATPHIAGVAALIVSQHENYTPLDVKAALMNTTEELNGDYSVFEVGAGRVNAFEAVKSDVIIQVNDVAISTDENGETIEINDITGDFSFGRQDKDTPISKEFTIYNNGSENKEFRVETVFTTSIVSPIDNPEDQGVSINLPNTIKVNAGQWVNKNMEITIPKLAMNGTYEGYVILTNVNDENEDYRLPFAMNVGEKFINLEVIGDMFSLGEFHPYQGRPGFWIGFEVSDKFDTLDVLIKDGETNEYIGYVGSLLTDILPTNTYLESGPMVDYGYYCPILKNSNGKYYIDPNSRKLSEDKRYTIEFLAVDKTGEIVKAEDEYFVDSVPPTIIMDEGSQPGIYEIEYNEENPDEIYYINGKVHDDYVEYAQNLGFETSQADNLLVFLEETSNWRNQGQLVLGEDGKITVGYPTQQVNEEGIIRLQVYPMDRASSGGYRTGLISYAFVRKGMPYLSTTCDESNFKIGDTGSVTFSGKNLSDFTLGSFTTMIPTDENGKVIFDLKDITPTEELQKFLDDNNMKLDISYELTEVEIGLQSVEVTCKLTGDSIATINGDMPLLNFDFEVVSDLYLQTMTKIISVGQGDPLYFNESVEYENTEGEIQTIEVLNVSKGIVETKNSYALGTVVPEGSIDEEGYIEKSLTEMGTKVTIIAPDGRKTEAALDAGHIGYIESKEIPVVDGIYTVVAETPGHLSSTSEAKLSYKYDDKIFGAYNDLIPISQFGGDVNGDGVIDIIDAVIIARAIGKEVPEVEGLCRDINRDGNIGKVDLDHVVRNFGIVDGVREGIASVEDEFDGMNLDEVIENMNKLYEDKGPEITINIEDGKVYNSQVDINVTSKDEVYSIHKVYVNGELFEGTSVFEDGKYEVKVEAMDDLGNKSETTVNFSIKTQGPKVTVTGVEDGKTYEGPVKPVVTVEDGAETTMTLNGNLYNCEEISAIGKYVLKITSKDNIGNVTELVFNFEIIEKSEKPDPEEPGKPNPEEPGKPDDGDSEETGKPSKPNLPQTGSIVGGTLMALVGVAVLGAGLVVLKRRKK